MDTKQRAPSAVAQRFRNGTLRRSEIDGSLRMRLSTRARYSLGGRMLDAEEDKGAGNDVGARGEDVFSAEARR
jgi:hypothetical protein